MEPVSVATLPDNLQAALASRDVIVFDGHCGLCAWAFRFVVKRDRAGRFAFATAQSEAGQALYSALRLPTDRFETHLVIVDGYVYTKAQGVGAALVVLGFPWALLGWLRHLPGWSADWAYDRIASNRYRLFGRRAECVLPDAELRSRFLT